MIIIGTAGHIDHGKSSIVKRLTGTDPDRLPEEKARGMTIDLGFAFYTTSSGEDIAFVDVPGHERFVKNMIAGVGGIDVAMLVIAADDGWMPQSQEHFQVIRLLEIKHGFIVINKVDLVEDKEWLGLLEQEIREKVKGSLLEDAPLFPVSAETGEGFDALREYLESLPDQVRRHKDIGKARLYIDRSFVRAGIGGVVTGTLQGGTFSVGQTVTVWPSAEKGKIRSLQSNNRDVSTAAPGQRTAMAFTGIDKELLKRGGVVVDRQDVDYFKQHPVLALSIELLPEAPISLTNRRKLLIIIGTTEMEGEIRLVPDREIPPGEKAIVFFKPNEPMYTLVGDHFIARLPTPMVTIGGGMVLDHLEHVPRQKQIERYAYLHARVSGTLRDVIISELQKNIIVDGDRFLEEANFSRSEIMAEVEKLEAENIIGKLELSLYHRQTFEQACNRFVQAVTEFLDQNPHLVGVVPEQLAALSPYRERVTTSLITALLAAGTLAKTGDKYNLAGRGIRLKGAVKKAHDEIMNTLRAAPYAPPTLSKLAEGGKAHKEAIKYIIETHEGYKCGSDFLFLREVWQEIVRFITEKLADDDSLAVADLREKFGFTRKFAIPILEETDRIGLTRRHGDVRIKGEKFGSEEFNI